MRYHIVVVVAAFFVFSCRKKNNVPAGILSQRKMQLIMWDMMRADQFLADFVLNNDSMLNKRDVSIKYYQQIFSVHKISEQDFQKSLYYYRTHPSLFKTIMDSLSQVPGDAPTQVVNPVVANDSTPVKPVNPLPADSSFRVRKIKRLN
jgi:hypothetical protein